MTNGFWGSRFPIDNLLCSQFIRAAVRWRIVSRRARNSLRRPVQHIQLVNGAATVDQLRYWLEQGYDKLNIGGGPKQLAGFINVDFVAHPNISPFVAANILDLSFAPTACASHIHSNHVLEHLTNDQMTGQLKEFHRILKQDGLLTIRCPNALGAAFGFWFEPVLEEEKGEYLRLGFPPDEDIANTADKWVHRDLFALLHWFYGDMGNIENQHLNVITPTKLKRAVEGAGFAILKMTNPETLNIVVVASRL